MADDDAHQEKPRTTPWGPWATAGLGLLIAGAFLASQVVVLLVSVALKEAQGLPVEPAKELESYGLLFSLGIVSAWATCISLIALFIFIRRGPRFTEYLRLKAVPGKFVVKWLLIALLVGILTDGLMWLLGEEVVPRFMQDIYRTADILPLLWLALIVAAPVGEELFFRGFLFEGFLQSRLRVPGTIVLTSVLWTVVHSLQYSVVQLTVLFFYGILLGVARVRTNSLWTPISIHAFLNLLATLEVALLLRTKV